MSAFFLVRLFNFCYLQSFLLDQVDSVTRTYTFFKDFMQWTVTIIKWTDRTTTFIVKINLDPWLYLFVFFTRVRFFKMIFDWGFISKNSQWIVAVWIVAFLNSVQHFRFQIFILFKTFIRSACLCFSFN